MTPDKTPTINLYNETDILVPFKEISNQVNEYLKTCIAISHYKKYGMTDGKVYSIYDLLEGGFGTPIGEKFDPTDGIRWAFAACVWGSCEGCYFHIEFQKPRSTEKTMIVAKTLYTDVDIVLEINEAITKLVLNFEY